MSAGESWTRVKDEIGDVYKRISNFDEGPLASLMQPTWLFPLAENFEVGSITVDAEKGERCAIAEICAQKNRQKLTQPGIISLERHDVAQSHPLLFYDVHMRPPRDDRRVW